MTRHSNISADDTRGRSPLDSVAPVTRRLFLAGAGGGIGWSLLSGLSGASAATPSPSPLLPGEYTRKSNQVTRYSGTLYDNVVVKIKGDPARIYIPQSIKPGQTTPIRVVWLYHGAGSDHNALDGGFKTTGERIVDQGAIAICQKAGGTLYSHPTAQLCQVNGYAYLAGLYPIAGNYLRATSGGGALACETYGARLIPDILGMYNVNAVYDLTAVYNQGGDPRATVIAAFGDNPAAIQAANPARHPQSAWSGSKLRIVVSQPNETDRTVPPEQHGLALLALAHPVAAEASLRAHANGHSTPGFADTDFVVSMQRWAPAVTGPVDATGPTVAISSPADGAVVSGSVLLTATAADDSGVTAVGFSAGSQHLGNATLVDGLWSLPFDTTRVPDGPYAVTATATDGAGNSSASSPVNLLVQNADTAPPSVSITSPTAGASLAGMATFTATATDNVTVSGVTFALGVTQLGNATLSDGVWSLTADTTSIADGSYDVVATATDGSGNSSTSSPVGVLVQNADTAAPSVSITSPGPGASLAGTVTFTATASDNAAVSGVTFALGATQLGSATLTGGVWSLAVDTKTIRNGPYDATATATDSSGNSSVSAPVSITVQNADTTAPSVVITSPTNGAVVSGTVKATATATDDVGVTGVSFYSGTRLIGPGTLVDGVWTLNFNTKTSTTPNGTYNITARARDAAGNVGVSPAVSIRIAN